MAVAKTLSHPEHPHPLTRVHLLMTCHTCDGCKTKAPGGAIYRCEECNFDLHEHCATLPADRLPADIHPDHGDLVRAVGPERESGGGWRICDVCMERVLGGFYRCTQCEFDVHPCCSQLPAVVAARELHREHNLVLRHYERRRRCASCRADCAGWRYCCDPCGVDYHVGCLLPEAIGKEVAGHRKGKNRHPSVEIDLELDPSMFCCCG